MKGNIPSKVHDLAEFMRSVASTIEQDPASFGIDPDRAAALVEATNAFCDARRDSVAAKLDSKSGTAAMKAAKAAALRLYRLVANQSRFNPAVAEESLQGIGASRRKARSPIPAPAEPPLITVTERVPGGFHARYATPGTTGFQRAKGAIGVMFSVVDGTNSDTSADEPTRGAQTFQSRGKSRCIVNAAIGKPAVRIYACWVTARGLMSPWSRPVTLQLLPA